MVDGAEEGRSETLEAAEYFDAARRSALSC